MRQPLDRTRLRAVLAELGRAAGGPATLYLVGGATAIDLGWRGSTIDIDIVIEPDRDDVMHAIPGIKERLNVSIEFASPLDFLPELPGWRDRSPYVMRVGAMTVRHFDPYAQALAKLERGFDQDRADADALLARGLVDPTELRRLLAAIESSLYRFPAVDAPSLRAAVDRVTLRIGEAPPHA